METHLRNPNARRTLVSLVSAALLGVAVSGCESELFTGRITRSRHFEYHDRESTALCPMLLPVLDEYFERLPTVTGLRADAASIFRYYKFRDLDEITRASACPGKAGACATEESILSPLFFDTHELAHAYAVQQWGGRSNVLLNEGIAVALSCKPTARYTFSADDRLQWRTLLRHSDAGNWSWSGVTAASSGYAAVGAFVTSLATRYGWARVGELYRRVAPGGYDLDFEREFARVMPTSLDEAWDHAFVGSRVATCVKDPRCDLAAQPSGESLGTPTCAAVRGRPLALDVHAGVVLSLLGSGVAAHSCSDPDRTYWLPGSGTSDQPTNHWLSLPPDRYLLDTDAKDPPRDLAVVQYLDEPLVAPVCEHAQPVNLQDSHETFIELPPGEWNGWLALAGDGSAYGLEWMGSGPSVQSLQLCTGCGDTAVCTPLSGRISSASLDSAATLRFDHAVSEGWGQLRIVALD